MAEVGANMSRTGDANRNQNVIGDERFADRLASMAKQVRAIHHYGDPPDARLAHRVDSDVEDILDLVYGIIEDMERENAHGDALAARLHDFPSLRAYVAALEKDAELGAALRPHLPIIAGMTESPFTVAAQLLSGNVKCVEHTLLVDLGRDLAPFLKDGGK